MNAIWFRLRAELRSGWRAWVGLALLVGIAAGVSTAAIAGARRTESAYPRFLRAQDGFHAATGGGEEEEYEGRLEEIRALPEVADSTLIVLMGAELIIPAENGMPERVLTVPDVFTVVDPDGRLGYETHRAKVIEGRMPDPSRADEVTVPFTFADRHGIEVGDRLIAGIGFDEAFRGIVHTEVTVAAIVASPGDFEAVGQSVPPNLVGTPALFERYRDVIPPLNPETWNIGVHLRGGPAAAPAFKAKVESSYGLDVPVIEPVLTSGVQETMRLYAAALWIIGILIGVATLAAFAQTLSRQMLLDAGEYPALRALGFGRRHLFTLGMLRAVVVAGVATPLTIGLAFLLSPLAPIGTARTAEAAPGFAFDPSAIGSGAGAAVVIVLLVAMVPAWRTARLAPTPLGNPAELAGARAPSLASRITRSVSTPSISAGLRMALEAGRGRTAVPVRSTVLAVAVGLAAVTGVAVVGSSLGHLIDTPRLAGLTYDAIVPSDDDEDDDERAAQLASFDFIDQTTPGTGLNVSFEGVDAFVVAFREDTPIGFSLIDGESPTDALNGGLPEIALGPGTFQRLGVSLGDAVEFPYDAQDGSSGTVSARVVGVAAIPPLPWAVVEPGEGGVMTTGAIDGFSPGSGIGCCYVTFKEGVDLVAARDELAAAGFEALLRTQRADLGTLERITSLPVLLAALFGVMAVGALVHVLLTGIRRRRRDLAILKTIGLVRRQVRAVVAWQAGTIALLCVIVGVPSGVALGRWGWTLVADRFGVVPVSVAPVLLLAAILPTAVVVANLIALGPARAAARTAPAIVLRSE